MSVKITEKHDFTRPMTIEECRRRFSYDPKTGVVTRKIDDGKFRQGEPVGFRNKKYLVLVKSKKKILLHRLIWAIYYGDWPVMPVDHVNMDGHDNRIENLRLASVAQNNRNRPRQSNNTSGYKGVTLHKGSGKFQAKIMANKVTRSLGYYHSAEEASEAYRRAAQLLHGDFMRADGGLNVR